MKQKIKRITKKLGIYFAAVTAVAILAITGWEQVRTPIVDWYDGDTVIIERKHEPTEFDMYRQTVQVLNENSLSCVRMKLEQQEEDGYAQQAELERQKEELRARELEGSSLL